jgi:AcrR family transcriptional regulator
MENILSMKNWHIQIEVSPKLYSKNPDSTDLGRKIISKSIEMIHEMGFEKFNFKKLGLLIDSSESSIYRYFDNKHSLLIYLTSWYWSWTEYRLVFSTANIDSPYERLRRSIGILTKPVLVDHTYHYVNEVELSEIVFSESLKIYHTKDVDEENKKGFFKAYKKVVKRVSDIALEIKPDFEFPHMLISAVIEGAHQLKYFAEHLPSLTDKPEAESTISEFYNELVFKTLE